jgi:succinyl-diaminopimelate desuccinylase
MDSVVTPNLNDPVALTQQMVRTNTVNPPGNEAKLAAELRDALTSIGLTVVVQALEPERANVIAWNQNVTGPRLCFTGHLDTVPLGTAAWRHAAHGGEIVGDRLYGRGTSDMKSGIAAFLCALARCREESGRLPPVLIVLTAGEETGCEGAKRLAELDLAGLTVGALIVGEPTSNQCAVGHKGALWIQAKTQGKTAHGAMPELGENAIYHAVDAIQQLRQYDFDACPDPLLGNPTLNIGTIAGGLNVNSVPDSAVFDIDIRTVCGMSHEQLTGRLETYLGEKVKLRARVDVPALSNDLANPWIHRATHIVESVTGECTRQRTVAYFSDGPILRQLFGEVPTIVLGPGEPSCAHQTDEWCSVENIRRCTSIYLELLQDWT